MSKTKHCPRCSKDKPLDEFYPAKTREAASYCKVCIKEYTKLYRVNRKLRLAKVMPKKSLPAKNLSAVVRYEKCSECSTVISIYKSNPNRKTCSKECAIKRNSKIAKKRKVVVKTEGSLTPSYIRTAKAHSEEECAYAMLPDTMSEDVKREYIMYCREHGYVAFTKKRTTDMAQVILVCSSVV